MTKWTSPSSSSNKEYESIHADDGKLLRVCMDTVSCDPDDGVDDD